MFKVLRSTRKLQPTSPCSVFYFCTHNEIWYESQARLTCSHRGLGPGPGPLAFGYFFRPASALNSRLILCATFFFSPATKLYIHGPRYLSPFAIDRAIYLCQLSTNTAFTFRLILPISNFAIIHSCPCGVRTLLPKLDLSIRVTPLATLPHKLTILQKNLSFASDC